MKINTLFCGDIDGLHRFIIAKLNLASVLTFTMSCMIWNFGTKFKQVGVQVRELDIWPPEWGECSHRSFIRAEQWSILVNILPVRFTPEKNFASEVRFEIWVMVMSQQVPFRSGFPQIIKYSMQFGLMQSTIMIDPIPMTKRWSVGQGCSR